MIQFFCLLKESLDCIKVVWQLRGAAILCHHRNWLFGLVCEHFPAAAINLQESAIVLHPPSLLHISTTTLKYVRLFIEQILQIKLLSSLLHTQGILINFFRPLWNVDKMMSSTLDNDPQEITPSEYSRRRKRSSLISNIVKYRGTAVLRDEHERSNNNDYGLFRRMRSSHMYSHIRKPQHFSSARLPFSAWSEKSPRT
jgi:hypothetical protein